MNLKKGILALAFASVLSSAASADTINDVLRKAVACNPKVLAAKQNRLAIDQEIVQARGGYFPQVKATVSWGPEWSRNSNTLTNVVNGSTPSVTMPVREIGLSVDQMVFDGFATRGEVLRQTARANSAAFQLLGAIQDTAFSAAQAYLDVIKEMKLVEVAEENVRMNGGTVHNIGLRTKKGISTSADSIQAQGQLALAESNLYAEKNMLQDAMARYKLVVGDCAGELTIPPELMPCLLPQSEQASIDSAINYNPILKAAQADIQATYEQREVARARNWPRVDLTARLDRNRNEGGIRGPDFDEYIYAKVSYDLFAGGSIIGRQCQTQHQLEQAQDIMYNTYREAVQNSKLAWNQYVTSRQLLPLLESHRQASKNTINAYQKQFNLSKRTLMDVLNVQTEYYQASRAYVEGQFKVLAAEYQLLHTTGRLVQSLGVPLPCEINIYKLC